MAKGFTTYRAINGKEPLLRHMVCEVRCRDGHLYIDHCGRLLRKLLHSSPDWVVAADPNSNGTKVFHLSAGVTLNLSMQGASLELNKTATDECISAQESLQFAELADSSFGLIFDELEITEWSRIGFRELYYFPCETKADSEQWMRELGLVSLSASVATSFEGRVDSVGVAVVVEGEDCSFRIAINGIERPAQLPVGAATLTIRSSGLSAKQDEALNKTLLQKRQRQINAAFAAVVDIDAYRNDPIELDVAGFIQECTTKNLDRFRDSLSTPNGKKGR